MRLLVLSTALALLVPEVADACTPYGYPFHETDSLHANDVTAPSAVDAGVPSVARFPSDHGGGCGAQPGCEGPNGHLTFSVAASDNATPGDRLGYKITVAGGRQPGFFIPHEAIRAESDGTLRLDFYGDDLGAFELDLEIRAIDLNGNLGPPVILTISDDGEESGGCTLASRTPSLVTTFALLALAALVRRKSRR